jgi:hypothetical protein
MMQLLRGMVASLLWVPVMAVGAIAAESLPKLAGQDYGKARAALLRQGWPIAAWPATSAVPAGLRCTSAPELAWLHVSSSGAARRP